ncbi:MAG: hypothetical protein V4450_16320 [Bacteroidota bacterium]
MRRIKESILRGMTKTDWELLVFLLLVMNVKLWVKLLAIVFIYFRRPDFSFTNSLKQFSIPLFYPAMILIAIIDLLLFSLYKEQNYLPLFITGIFFWVGCILIVHQLLLVFRYSDPEKIHNALFLFFLINVLASCVNLGLIVREIHQVNPYTYQGMHQKYFIGTGDYIKGISFDTSTTNAMLNAFGIVYFLSRKQFVMTLLCMAVLLLTCSNFTNLLVLACLAYFFIFKTDRDQKSIIVVQLIMLVVFMANVSPQNNKYAIKVIERTAGHGQLNQKNTPEEKIIPIAERPDSVLSTEEKKYKTAKKYLDSVATIRAAENIDKNHGTLTIKPIIPTVNIHAPEYQHVPDSSEARMQAVRLLRTIQERNKTMGSDTIAVNSQVPGKIQAFKQLARFMQAHPSKIVTGDGMGNFSSKLAFRATGLQIAGSYPSSLWYIHEDFKQNHLTVYLDYFARDSGYHSVTHSPNSVYAQLLGEYGIAGILAFVAGYLFYFSKRILTTASGVPLLLLMLGAFITDYWFEQLSIVILFELLIILNRQEIPKTKSANL